MTHWNPSTVLRSLETSVSPTGSTREPVIAWLPLCEGSTMPSLKLGLSAVDDNDVVANYFMGESLMSLFEDYDVESKSAVERLSWAWAVGRFPIVWADMTVEMMAGE